MSDGQGAGTALFEHEYPSAGTYAPRFTVRDTAGRTTSAQCSFTVTVDRASITTLAHEPAPTGGGSQSSPWSGCSFNGTSMWGRVQIVDYFADFDVQIVDYFPDLKVQEVDALPTSCGKWQFVDSFPDFTVRFVDYFPDFKIQYVEYFPGR